MGEIPKQPIIGPTCRRSVYLARAPIWSVNSKVEQASHWTGLFSVNMKCLPVSLWRETVSEPNPLDNPNLRENQPGDSADLK